MLLQAISGSRAYGLHTPQSDTDIRGVFYLPKHDFYGLHYVPQVSNESNDLAYYELGRFIELLVKNNPNILELLNTPTDCLLYRNPVMDMIKPEIFLSKLCLDTFAGYAQTQVKKASGLNKKIFNPVATERKTVIDFCYFISGNSSLPLQAWLDGKGYRQEDCGLVNIAHAKDIYALYHQSKLKEGSLMGIYSGEAANDVRLSPVEKGAVPEGIISFNKNGYSIYCKDYREYHQWVEKRNDVRYNNTLEHGKNYDAKNMMHTFRLLGMAEEIALEHKVNVRRVHDKVFLFKVRSGEYTYNELVNMASDKITHIQEIYAKSTLCSQPDEAAASNLLAEMRERLYKNKTNKLYWRV